MNRDAGKQTEAPGSNFPGLGFATAMAGAWTRYLSAQTSVFNSLWSDLTSGTLTVGSLAQNSARLWQAYYDGVRDVVKRPFAADTPRWLWFEYSKKADNSLYAPVQLATVQDAGAQLDWTDLRAVGGGGVVPEAQISVTWTDDLRREALNVELQRAPLAKLPDGQYLGFVYNRRAWASAPLAIVALNIIP